MSTSCRGDVAEKSWRVARCHGRVAGMSRLSPCRGMSRHVAAMSRRCRGVSRRVVHASAMDQLVSTRRHV
eukprot:7377488-Prymnesium_polylepis.1